VKKRVPTIVGIFALILLLAGAAYVGGRLLNGQGLPILSSGEPRKQVTPAAEVPTTQPDARGNVIRRDGNSLFICEPLNDITLINEDGTVDSTGDCGPEFEVVIGHNTVLLHDVTARQYAGSPMPGSDEDLILQQAVEPGLAKDISEGTVVRVWGPLTGNRIAARTLLYWNRSPPPLPPGP
jgi:hypothetical protein